MTVEQAREPICATLRHASERRGARRAALSIALLAATWPAIAQADSRVAEFAIQTARVAQPEVAARAYDPAGTRVLPWVMACACVAAATAARGFATANHRSRQPAARKA